MTSGRLPAAQLIRAVGRRNPTRLVTAAGTVGVTALGMAGRSGGAAGLWIGVVTVGIALVVVDRTRRHHGPA
jgi:hypothetical protein